MDEDTIYFIIQFILVIVVVIGLVFIFNILRDLFMENPKLKPSKPNSEIISETKRPDHKPMTIDVIDINGIMVTIPIITARNVICETLNDLSSEIPIKTIYGSIVYVQLEKLRDALNYDYDGISSETNSKNLSVSFEDDYERI